jgi:TetR/AcrR family transcriptional regulator, transcriptional repressor for nem operon
MKKKVVPTREATKQETRDALIAAGTIEFAEKGLDGPSLDSICERAGFTRGAFYVHFRDRDELLVAVVDKMLTSFHDAVIASGDSPDDLQATIGAYVAAAVAGAPATRGRMQWHFHDTLAAVARSPVLRERYVSLQRQAIDRVAKAAKAGQRAGAVRRDVPAEAMGEILVTLTLGITAMLEVGVPFDLQAGGLALTKLLRPAPKR